MVDNVTIATQSEVNVYKQYLVLSIVIFWYKGSDFKLFIFILKLYNTVQLNNIFLHVSRKNEDSRYVLVGT